MIIKPELVKKIKSHFDLNIYETKVWLSLLSKGIASAGEIAEISGVPRSRTYDVLESLEKRGFAMQKIGKPVKYIAVSPNLVLEKLKSNAVRTINDKIKVLSNLKNTAEYLELESLHNSKLNSIKKEAISGTLKGGNNINSHLFELIESAKKEVIICSSTSKILSKVRFFSSLFEKLKNRKIKLNLALSGSIQDIKKIKERFNVKIIKFPVKSDFFVIDQEQVILLLNQQENNEDLAIWFNSVFFASALSYLFTIASKSRIR